MKPDRPTCSVICFRLKPEEIRLLAERADRLGMTPNELARHHIIEAIFSTMHLAEQGADLSAVQEQSLGLRLDLATASALLPDHPVPQPLPPDET